MMTSKMERVFSSSLFSLDRVPCAPFATNAYIVRCLQSGESVLVDAPGEAERLSKALEESTLRWILLTHGHGDHTGALVELAGSTGAAVAAHEADAGSLPLAPQRLLAGGDSVAWGNLEARVIHTPGHTPGSICFYLEGVLLAGDTIFPGGPGKTAGAAEFKTIMASISEEILTLPPATLLFPGHGEGSTVEEQRSLVASFRARNKTWPEGGDVSWL